MTSRFPIKDEAGGYSPIVVVDNFIRSKYGCGDS